MWYPLAASALKDRLQVCTRADLLNAGHTDHQVRKVLRQGRLLKLGSHWYGTAATPFAVAAALRSNHRLTCVSALELHGVFVPATPWPHEVGRQCSCPQWGQVMEHRPLRRWPDDEPVTPLPMALQHAASCLDAEGAAIVLESALHQRMVTGEEADRAIGGRRPGHRVRLQKPSHRATQLRQ